MALSERAKTDPTKSLKLEKRYEKGILPLIDNFERALLRDFNRAWEGRSLEAGKIKPDKLFPKVEDLAEKEIRRPSEKVINDVVPKAYDQGQVFASVQLGAPIDERQRVWSKVKALLENHKNEFKGFSDETARRVNRIIGDGIVNEKTQGQIIKDLQNEIEMSRGRATRIIRTETMKAVNTGVLDRYKRAGLEPKEPDRIPPFHPGCRCTLVPKRIDGEMVLVILACADERTCVECMDLDGAIA